MNLVANINGVRVYSDKPVVSIINTRVHFSDGSYADVSTNEVVNRGEGIITLGQPPSESAGGTPVVSTKSFRASQLSISNVNADVEIQPGGDQIVVTLTGPKSGVEAITIEEESGRVVVQGKGDSKVGGNIVISGGSVVIGGNISVGSIRGGGISISTSTGESQVKIDIRVSIGTALDVSSVTGSTNIGDTLGSLVLTQGGQSRARIGRVGTAQLSTAGQSEIRAREISGNLTASTSGQSKIDVERGEIATLVVNTSGQSEFDFKGKATNAMLNASGQSEIKVTHVVNRPMKASSGQSDIIVRNWKD